MASQGTRQTRSLIAHNIDRGIQAKGLTNREVGEQIGTTEHQVWRWRRGKHTPSLDNLVDLARVLFNGEMGELYAGLNEKDAA